MPLQELVGPGHEGAAKDLVVHQERERRSKPLDLAGLQWPVQIVSIDDPEFLEAGHAHILQVKLNDAVHNIGIRLKQHPERPGLHIDGVEDDTVEIEDDGAQSPHPPTSPP